MIIMVIVLCVYRLNIHERTVPYYLLNNMHNYFYFCSFWMLSEVLCVCVKWIERKWISACLLSLWIYGKKTNKIEHFMWYTLLVASFPPPFLAVIVICCSNFGLGILSLSFSLPSFVLSTANLFCFILPQSILSFLSVWALWASCFHHFCWIHSFVDLFCCSLFCYLIRLEESEDVCFGWKGDSLSFSLSLPHRDEIIVIVRVQQYIELCCN